MAPPPSSRQRGRGAGGANLPTALLIAHMPGHREPAVTVETISTPPPPAPVGRGLGRACINAPPISLCYLSSFVSPSTCLPSPSLSSSPPRPSPPPSLPPPIPPLLSPPPFFLPLHLLRVLLCPVPAPLALCSCVPSSCAPCPHHRCPPSLPPPPPLPWPLPVRVPPPLWLAGRGAGLPPELSGQSLGAPAGGGSPVHGGRWGRPGPAVWERDCPHGAWRGACGRRPGRGVPPVAEALSLNETLPLRGHRAHAPPAGSAHLTEGGVARPAGRWDSDPHLSTPSACWDPAWVPGRSWGVRQDSRSEKEKGKKKKGLQGEGRGLPSRVGTPAPPPSPCPLSARS